jgi:hypothetical protein
LPKWDRPEPWNISARNERIIATFIDVFFVEHSFAYAELVVGSARSHNFGHHFAPECLTTFAVDFGAK